MNTRAALIKALIVLVIFTLFAGIPSIGQADDDAICPAVYPCDDNGEYLSILENIEGICRKRFEAQCRKVRDGLRKSCGDVSEQYNQLQITHQKTLTSVGKLKKELRRVKSSK